MQTSVSLQSLPFSSAKTYFAATLFIVANIAVPQLFHLVPQGGATWLPIYFFTLIGAYKFGWRVGLLTAMFSPLINSLLFAMPAAAALPAITLKSVLLAVISAYAAARFSKADLILLVAVVLAYQIFGTLGEWALNGDFILACQDFRLGIPGMLLQIFGAWFILRLKFDRPVF